MVDRPDELSEFPVMLRLPIQWGDQDAFAHVNNVVHFRWFESARIAYCEQVGMAQANDGIGPILASIRCDYRRQVRYPDTIQVGARITRLGRSSMTMLHRAFSTAQQATVADGESTLVCFDYAEQRSEPIPDDLRRQIERLEGRPL